MEENGGGGSFEVYRPTAANFSFSYNNPDSACYMTLPSGGTWYVGEGLVNFTSTYDVYTFNFAPTIFINGVGHPRQAYFAGGTTLSVIDKDMSVPASATFYSTTIIFIRVE